MMCLLRQQYQATPVPGRNSISPNVMDEAVYSEGDERRPPGTSLTGGAEPDLLTRAQRSRTVNPP